MLLAPWWERIRDLLDGDIAFRARRLADGGLERLFADLDPSIRVDGDTLAVSGRLQGLRDLAGEGLVLLPSAFVWPGLVLVLAVAEPASTAVLARRLGHSPIGIALAGAAAAAAPRPAAGAARPGALPMSRPLPSGRPAAMNNRSLGLNAGLVNRREL
jgi:hypothetical protein